MLSVRTLALAAATACIVSCGPIEVAASPRQVAQLGTVGPGGPPYGYQPYNDRNPTGLYHPNGMGFGHYSMTQKYHGHRFRAFRYRKFRGT